jgi:hypothetical protein
VENIKQFNTFLPDNIIQPLATELTESGFVYGWRSSSSIGFGHWNNDFTKAGPENGLDVSTELTGTIATAWNYIQENYFPNSTLIRCYANAHTYGVEGYPHVDSIRLADNTLVVYLNRTWKREWGGETMFYDKYTITHAELPSFNKAVCFPGHVTHQAKGVSRICPAARITLMFKFAETGIDPLRDRLQKLLQEIGANKKKHTNHTLMSHLLTTYDLLTLAEQNDTVRVAGALHSVFGTNAFTDVTLDKSSKDILLTVVSAESLRLVELFSTVNRPTALENMCGNKVTSLPLTDGSECLVTQEEFDSLCVIEAANLHEQKSLDKYPNLSRLWATVYHKIDN